MNQKYASLYFVVTQRKICPSWEILFSQVALVTEALH